MFIVATWTALAYSFGSLLTSLKMTQNQANFTALAEGAASAPSILYAALNLSNDIVAGDIATNAVGQSEIAANAVGQAELKTSTGSVSTTGTANFTLPGAQYGLYPTLKKTAGAGNITAQLATNYAVTTSQVANIYLVAAGVSLQAHQRYITASAPFNLGNGDIPIFVFAMIDTNTGDVIGTYVADTPPWFYNGRPRNTFDPKKYKRKFDLKTDPENDKKKIKIYRENYFYDQPRELPNKETDFATYLEAVNNPQFEEIEITPAMKNLDMDIIPHPFMGNDLTGKSIVLLDPVGSMAEKMRDLHDMGESVADLLHGRYLLIDNEDAGAISPVGVKTHKVKWK